jgi:FAD/FMN-containing dehydrogenase
MSAVSRGSDSASSHSGGAFNALRDRLNGNLQQPGDPGYDDARRVFNAMIDRHPAAIASCADTADVVASVDFARQHGIPLSVRGGGHSVAGDCLIDGGLVIDVLPMKRIDVDAGRRVARAQAGLRLGEFIDATEQHGFVSPTGTNSDTGMAGLTLGGGFGWLCGHFGMAIDNVVGAEVVLSDGTVVHASDSEHQDLFWAIRGGSGNFGIVTEFEMKLHPLTAVLGGMLIHPFDRATEVLRHYREIVPSLPDELTIYTGILTAPDGNKVIAVVACWSGDLAEGERVLAPIRAFGPPLVDTIQPMPYSAMNRLLDEGLAPGQRNYWKQSYFQALEDDFIEVVIEFARKAPSANSVVLIDELHGAATRVSPSATAFPHRDARFGLVMLAVWNNPADDDINIQWTRDLANAARPYGTGGVYVNEAVGEKPLAVYGANYERLAEIKARYDPANMFRHNANIAPAAVPPTGEAAD